MSTALVPAQRVREQIAGILTAWGMQPEPVAITADVMVETDLWGVDSHGLSMLMMYEDMLREGRLNVHAAPKVLDRTAVTARIDGDAGLGHPVAWQGMDLAVDMALAGGLGAVTAFNSHHFRRRRRLRPAGGGARLHRHRHQHLAHGRGPAHLRRRAGASTSAQRF